MITLQTLPEHGLILPSDSHVRMKMMDLVLFPKLWCARSSSGTGIFIQGVTHNWLSHDWHTLYRVRCGQRGIGLYTNIQCIMWSQMIHQSRGAVTFSLNTFCASRTLFMSHPCNLMQSLLDLEHNSWTFIGCGAKISILTSVKCILGIKCFRLGLMELVLQVQQWRHHVELFFGEEKHSIDR